MLRKGEILARPGACDRMGPGGEDSCSLRGFFCQSSCLFALKWSFPACGSEGSGRVAPLLCIPPTPGSTKFGIL